MPQLKFVPSTRGSGRECDAAAVSFKTRAGRAADDPAMTDVTAAAAFMDTHARLLDRRRFDALTGAAPPDGVLAALAAYRNPDGGFGWALEPDLRSSASQPAGALHAFEVLAEAGVASPLAADLCDWLESVTLPGGGLPFALAGADSPGTAPWWAGADLNQPSLHITSAVCAYAHRVPQVADHPWLQRATEYCLRAIAALAEPQGAHQLSFALQFLDAVGAAAELERLARFLPPSGELAVPGGLPDEKLRPLDHSPRPGPLRRHIAPKALERDLDRLAAEQRADGGWEIDFAPASPAATIEWRGYVTLRAIAVLRANGR
jgi:hypothetical protein